MIESESRHDGPAQLVFHVRNASGRFGFFDHVHPAEDGAAPEPVTVKIPVEGELPELLTTLPHVHENILTSA
jgi:hypothetical protein